MIQKAVAKFPVSAIWTHWKDDDCLQSKLHNEIEWQKSCFRTEIPAAISNLVTELVYPACYGYVKRSHSKI